jgi:transposase
LSLALPPAEFFVGLDWAAEIHAVCVINMEGKVLSQFTVKHSADGITLLVRRLAKFGEPIDIPIGIERPDGRLVDLLLEAGHPVVPVSPNAIKTWREGEVLSGAKSDAADAAVIAEYLRLRRHRLTVAAPYSSETKAVRTVVRTRDDLVAMRVAAVNQLAALLDAHWPGAKAIFADLESKIALEFLSRYPTPSAAAHLGEKRIAGFCAAHGYSGRRPAAELLSRLRSAPAGATDPHLTAALKDAVLAMVAVIGAVNAAVKNLDKSVAARLGEPRTGRSSRRCQGRVRSTPPRCSPSGATAGKPT